MRKSPIRLIVNAVPLMNIHTGISRYLQGLYGAMTGLYGDRLDIGYFDGVRVRRRPPGGPSDLDRWSTHVDRFWRLPTLPAVFIRLAVQLYREVAFRKASRHYDVYHEAAFFPFAGRPGLKTVFTVHDLSLQRFPQFHPAERVRFCRLFFEARCGTVDHFLTVSRFTKQEMETILALRVRSLQERLTITPLAHDPEVFFPRSPQEMEAARIRFGLPQDYFMFVGSGDPRKNRLIIPEALRRARLSIPLAVAGWRGWSGGASESHSIPLGYISDEDLARLYGGALALICPSLYEGFGLPVLEAMACGCPVICSRKASLPEVGGDAAVYIHDPLDSGELADCLSWVASDASYRSLLRAKSLQRASTFSWDRTARATFEVFQEALACTKAFTCHGELT